MVIAPEHPLLDSLTSPQQREAVQAYVREATSKSDLQRTELQKQKTGVSTGMIEFCLAAIGSRVAHKQEALNR